MIMLVYSLMNLIGKMNKKNKHVAYAVRAVHNLERSRAVSVKQNWGA